MSTAATLTSKIPNVLDQASELLENHAQDYLEKGMPAVANTLKDLASKDSQKRAVSAFTMSQVPSLQKFLPNPNENKGE